MCTVSWCRPSPGCYALFFNRDERKTRLPAQPPRKLESEGTPFISPADGNLGGTWLLANAHGLSVGILNHDAASGVFSPKNPTSRGHLVLSLANRRTHSHIDETLATIDPAAFRPFILFAVTPDDARLWKWDGLRLSNEIPELPLTTSSYGTDRVVAARKQAFAEFVAPSPIDLANYHDSHDPLSPEFSVRMRRKDSQTVSQSRIDVTATDITFSYRPEPNATLSFGETVSIAIPRS